jgi:arylformamidase
MVWPGRALAKLGAGRSKEDHMARDIIDITATMGIEAPSWEGDPGFEQEVSDERDAGGGFVSRLSLSVHHGTHVDAPGHFVPGGAMLEAYPPQRWMLPACVVDARGCQAVGPEHVDAADAAPGEAVLFVTDNTPRGLIRQPTFTREFVALSLAGARRAAERQLGLVGIDYLSIEAFGSEGHPVHRALLDNDVLILEGANLSAVEPGRYELHCLPLKLSGFEASPVRAILL